MTTRAMRERGVGSKFHRESVAFGKYMAALEGVYDREDGELPDPMPARDAKGRRVWLHYRPLRWERHP